MAKKAGLRIEDAADGAQGPYSKVYWPNEAMKRQVQADAGDFGKSESGFIVLCVRAARNPVLFAELASYFGTQVGAAAAAQASDTRLREMEADLQREREMREAAEARASDLQLRLDEAEAEKRRLLDRLLAEADLRGSPVAGVVRREAAGPVETPPIEAVRAVDALTGGNGALAWAAEAAVLAWMKEKEGLSAPTALSLLRAAKRHDLVVDKQGRWALTDNGRAMAGA